MQFLFIQAVLVLFPFLAEAVVRGRQRLIRRGPPSSPVGVKTIISSQGASITYKEPGKAGLCETTPGVNSYSGYISLDTETHVFFYFFEARSNPSNKPLTLWLNGGPGSDSLIGLFQENGPCNISANLIPELNSYSWNEVSNMLYLSQPVGVGFSFSTTEIGTILRNGTFLNDSAEYPAQGRYSLVDSDKTNTTQAAAIAAWHVLQAFVDLSPNIDSRVTNRTFNLATESYGGHYGPAFFDYFYDQNAAIKNSSISGVLLRMNSLMIINGLVDELTQAPYYPSFAVNNTYGVKSYNDSVYTSVIDAFYAPGGCKEQILNCSAANRMTALGAEICSNATNYCRRRVENPYYTYSGRGTYDIRHPRNDSTPPGHFVNFLNLASTQQALGVNINYTSTSSSSIGRGFSSTGDFVFPDFKTQLVNIINTGLVHVALVYGDADYICNWFGGQAVSLALEYTHADQFRAANYSALLVDSDQYGETRQFGRFSFTRLYESGHETPYYQPKAMLALFNRLINGLTIADGTSYVTDSYQTGGSPETTHTEPFPPLPT